MAPSQSVIKILALNEKLNRTEAFSLQDCVIVYQIIHAFQHQGFSVSESHSFLLYVILQLRREKIDLENTLEQEQEALVNRLWKRMDKLEAEKRFGFIFCVKCFSIQG